MNLMDLTMKVEETVIGEIYTHMINDEVKNVFAISKVEDTKFRNGNRKIVWTNGVLLIGTDRTAIVLNDVRHWFWFDTVRKATKEEIEIYQKYINSEEVFIEEITF